METTRNIMSKFGLDYNHSFMACIDFVIKTGKIGAKVKPNLDNAVKISSIVEASQSFGNFTLRNGGKY